jgi:uncharacterized membrane protein
MKEIKCWGIGIIALLIISGIVTLFGMTFIQSLRAVFGLVYVLFLPGYIVTKCFFKEIDWIEKLAISLGLSIALVILGVMISNLLFKVPITTLSNFIVILAIILITLLGKKYENKLKSLIKRK